MSLLASIVAAAEGAAEPSKTAFYVCGGLLAAWAVIVSVLGIVRPDFPERAGGARILMALSVLLVLGATSTAVITA